jgi:hypothetical protein
MADSFSSLTGGDGLNTIFPQNLSMSFTFGVLENRIAGIFPEINPKGRGKNESNP